MSGAAEYAMFMSDEQRRRVLQAMVEAYYADANDHKLIFDTSRAWCAVLPAIARLFPTARVICCVRSPAWILDSIERHVRSQPFQPSRMFKYESGLTVYHRAEGLIAPGGVLGASMHAFREAWFSENAGQLVVVRYESLCRQPADTMRRLYVILGEPYFEHDFDHLEYDEPEFDSRLGLPGFHRVAPRVHPPRRESILPPDIFERNDRRFWDDSSQNPRGVVML